MKKYTLLSFVSLVTLLGLLATDRSQPHVCTHIRSVDLLADDIPLLAASSTYDINAVRAGRGEVPRIKVTALSSRKPELTDSTPDRKAMFIKAMLPMILQVNEKILADRMYLTKLMKRSYIQLTDHEKAWVAHMAQRYKVPSPNMRDLLNKMDIVPPSLALGQSVEESGWGLSDVAAEKNSPFGQRVSVHKTAADGTTEKLYKLKTFNSLYAAIEGYIHNINSHGAYEGLRNKRKAMREQGKTISGYHLADGLTKYSELGRVYVRKVQNIILQNELTAFDKATLNKPSFSNASL